MTNKELQVLLQDYPDDMLIGLQVTCGEGYNTWVEIETADYIAIKKIDDDLSEFYGEDCIVVI